MVKISKTKSAYNRLKAMVFAGELTGNHSWSLRKLAAKFELSIAPVNVAVRQLENEGLLAILPQRGITLKQYTVPQIKEMYVIREAIEIQAIRIITLKKDLSLLKTLKKAAQKIEDISKKINKNYDLLDYEFHQKIIDATQSKLLIDEYKKFSSICIMSAETIGLENISNNIDRSVSHLDIVVAIESGNPEKAEKVLRKHIKSVASIMPSLRR